MLELLDTLAPEFVPLPGPAAMQALPAVSLGAGVCLAGGAALFLLLGVGRGRRGGLPWALMGVGALLILNHSVQLLF